MENASPRVQQIFLANPRGFCAGVDRAISIVEQALIKLGAPIYVRHEVVHNRFVVNSLKEQGVIFVDTLDEVPQGNVVIFSAHGVSLSVRQEAEARGLKVFDATCPLVTKVHLEVKKLRNQGFEIIMIGHKNHPEVEGTMGQAKDGDNLPAIHLIETISDVEQLTVSNPEKLSYVTQTTLSIDDTKEIVQALSKRFPKTRIPPSDSICYATQNRQTAVKHLTQVADIVIIIGSANSSNANRLREVAQNQGIPAYRIENADELDETWLVNRANVGISAGASTPEVVVKNVIQAIKQHTSAKVEELKGIEENVLFQLPNELKR